MKKRFFSIGVLALAVLTLGALFQESKVTAESSDEANTTLAILVAEWRDKPAAEFEAYFKDLPDDLRLLAHGDGAISHFQPGYQPADGHLFIQDSDGQMVEKDIFGPDAATVGEVRAAVAAARNE